MELIDLHTHSTASDGTLSPRELVRRAAEAGLAAVALTDHDTVAGLEEAVAQGKESGIEVIPGCELSVEWAGGPMHILGLWLDPEAPNLRRKLDFLHNARANRNRDMVAKLRALGVDITLEEVEAAAGGGSVGRPHMAQVLLAKKAVSSVQQAFDLYLGGRGKAHVPKAKLDPSQAVDILKRDKALALLAHPYLLKLSGSGLEAVVRELMGYGLDGIEAYYSEHDRKMTGRCLDLARRLGLLVSGGSDFHGAIKPDVSLGRGRGDLVVPVSVLKALKARRQERGLWV